MRALKKVTYNYSLHLAPSQHPCGHAIKIWALGNQHVFTMVAGSQGHMTICVLPSWLLTSKINGGSRIR